MKMSVATYLLFLCLVVRGEAPAQLADPPEVAALPVWPGDEEARAPDAGSFVFRDLATGAIVVSYPSMDDPTQGTMFKFFLGNRVDPSISVKIDRISLEQYSYKYTLTNGSRAATPIRAWSIVGPPQDPRLEISHPNWHAAVGRARAAAQVEVPGVPNGPFLSWQNPQDPLRIKQSMTGFSVVSTHGPGLTTAYAAGEGRMTAPSSIPEDVHAALEPLHRISVKRRPALTIGPRFPPGLDAREVAARFRLDLAAAIRAGGLDGQSEFIRELDVRIGESAASGYPPQIAVEPRAGIEAEIAGILEILFPAVPL